MSEWLEIIWHPDPAIRKARLKLLGGLVFIALLVSLGFSSLSRVVIGLLNPIPQCEKSATYGGYGVTSYTNQQLVNFQGAGKDFSCRDFSGSVLQNANFRGAKLTRTNFGGADLTNADLSGADLRGANLSGANLTGANLEAAKLRETNTTGVEGKEF